MRTLLLAFLLTARCALAQLDDVAFVGSLSGASGFSPSSVAGLYSWWDATDLGGADNSTVDTWTDKAKGIVLYKQGTPLLKTTINRGNKAVFSATSPVGMLTNAATFSVAQPTEYFLVLSNADSYIFDGITSTRQTLSKSSPFLTIYAGTSRTINGGDVGGWFVIDVLFNNSGTSRVLTNNVSVGSINLPGANGNSGFALLGAVGANGGSPFIQGSAYVSEVLVYTNGDLSSGDRLAVYQYLTNKWQTAQ